MAWAATSRLPSRGTLHVNDRNAASVSGSPALKAPGRNSRGFLDFIHSPILLAVVCAYTYYVLGAYEAQQGSNHNGLLWAVLSLLVSLAVLGLFKGGWGVLLMAQTALFIGIAVFRAMREP